MHGLRDSVLLARSSFPNIAASGSSAGLGRAECGLNQGDGEVKLGANTLNLIEEWLCSPLMLSDDDPSVVESISLTGKFEMPGNPMDEKTTVTTITEATPFGPDDDESLIEFHTIRNMRRLAVRLFQRRNYLDAEKLLEEVMKRSDRKYDNHYVWKGETTTLLAKSCCQQKKWDKAENILRTALDDSVIASIPEQIYSIKHALSEVNYSQGHFDEARELCVQAADGRKLSLGRHHTLYYQSTVLLMRIYRAKGEHNKAETLEGRLPDYYWGEECYVIDDMSRMNHEDAAAHVNVGLRHVLRPLDSWKWKEIKDNIVSGGLSGWGDGYNLVHALAEESFEAPLRFLIELESLTFNLEAEDAGGRTALHLATIRRHIRVVRLLVEKDANIEAKTRREQETPLILAANNDDLEIVRFLLDSGAEIEAQDGYEYTALHRAADQGAARAVGVLLENGADIAKQGNFGRTALHCAATRGHTEVVRLLLNKGADANTRDRGDHTPFDLAQQHRDVIRMFQLQSRSSRWWTFKF